MLEEKINRISFTQEDMEKGKLADFINLVASLGNREIGNYEMRVWYDEGDYVVDFVFSYYHGTRDCFQYVEEDEVVVKENFVNWDLYDNELGTTLTKEKELYK